MTVHRLLYKVCWKNKLIIPLLLICMVFSMIITLSFRRANVGEGSPSHPKFKPTLINHFHKPSTIRPQRDDDPVIVVPGKKKEIKTPDHPSKAEFDKLKKRIEELEKLLQTGKPEKVDPIQNNRHADQKLEERVKNIEKKLTINHDKVHDMLDKTLITPKPLPQNLRSKIFHSPKKPPVEFVQWNMSTSVECGGKFVGYNNEFAYFSEVIVDTARAIGKRNGGEEIKDVLNQPEEDEYYNYEMGFIKMGCENIPHYRFNSEHHLNKWMMSMVPFKKEELVKLSEAINNQFTIAVTRYEYANLYHTMTDFYNAFLLMEFFHKTQKETNILLVDGHPKGALDPVWGYLFNATTRLRQPNVPNLMTKYTQMVWNIIGYNSPMLNHYATSIPLVPQFREFFLNSYSVEDKKKLDCDKLSIIVIWRRDYLAHPRNPSGSLTRKILNEEDLLLSLRKNFPNYIIKGIQIDLFDMQQQLELVVNSDIMIGMHGAGLTHAFFLPKHAGLIELLPNYWSAANMHFQAIATWRNLTYQRWVNVDPLNEVANHKTKIPEMVIKVLTKRVSHMICTGKKLPEGEDVVLEGEIADDNANFAKGM